LQIPFGIAAGIALAAVLTSIFAVEVFMSEVYNGPFKQFLVDTSSDTADVGIHSDCSVFDFDTDVFGHLYPHLQILDQL